MKTAKIIGFSVLALGILGVSGATAQYYNQYGYQYPVQQYSYQYPTYSSAVACPVVYGNVTVGMSGTSVSELQRFLAARGYGQPVTGYYGSVTSANVSRFQQEQGVYPATGGVGPMTLAAIQRVCSGQTAPGYTTYPGRGTETFRLNRSFILYPGQSAHEYRGELTLTLNSIEGGYGGWPYFFQRDVDEVRITVGESCRQGYYCAGVWYPQRTFTLEEDDTVHFQDYEITLTELRNDRATFRVEEDDDDDDNDDEGTINVTAPDAGEVVEQGDELDIEWDVTDEPNNSAVILELYDEDDDRVGTIAIVDSDEDSFEWDVPERGGYCTQQYPNELCGYDLEGEYYIRATLVEGNGFDNGEELDEDDSPVFEIED